MTDDKFILNAFKIMAKHSIKHKLPHFCFQYKAICALSDAAVKKLPAMIRKWMNNEIVKYYHIVPTHPINCYTIYVEYFEKQGKKL